ncbi:PD-(D/E)XK nuclease superfamily protein [Planctomycetes bacterium Pan216]|uniref:CRISPR-associated exonuclease Cas4 n=1 Tax=Kolteria novifilia TaxID=2527975 RepID=A0A518B611_9BACT|nr:PD-(D/E)XK nuclease superfamily protein [Planctomycetes bacterium Pan216]
MSESSEREQTVARDEGDYPPLSSLNHLLFCERRCALLRIEQVWVENRYTLSGQHDHRRVHQESSSLHRGKRVVRNISLVSHRLRLSGKSDAVEFGDYPLPIEYKSGRRRRWDNDDVQLCAQALCLEEMLDVEIPMGAIFHLKSHRRRDVPLTASLRGKTEEAVARLHELLASGETPPPKWKPRCKGCSLQDLCLPTTIEAPQRLGNYQDDLYRPLLDKEVSD